MPVPNKNITAGSDNGVPCIISGIATAEPVIKKIAKNKNIKILNFIFGLLPFDLTFWNTGSLMGHEF